MCVLQNTQTKYTSKACVWGKNVNKKLLKFLGLLPERIRFWKSDTVIFKSVFNSASVLTRVALSFSKHSRKGKNLFIINNMRKGKFSTGCPTTSSTLNYKMLRSNRYRWIRWKISCFKITLVWTHICTGVSSYNKLITWFYIETENHKGNFLSLCIFRNRILPI